MALNNDKFIKSAQACKEVLSAGSALYLGALVDCGKTFKKYYTNFVDNGSNTVIVSPGGTSARMNLLTPNISTDIVILKVGQALTYISGGLPYTVYVTQEATIAFGGAGTVVNFTAAPASIGLNTASSVISIDTGAAIEPKKYFLQTVGTGSIGDTTINLKLIAPNVNGDLVILRKGARFRLDGTNNYYVVSADGQVGFSSTPVAIEPAPAAWVTATSVPYAVYEMVQVLSTSELPISFADTTEDTTDHADGMQYSMTKTNYDITTAVTFRLRCEDPAMVNIIMPGADANVRVYAVLSQGAVDGCGMLLYGEAQLVNVNTTAAVKSFVKGTLTIQWQAPTVVLTKIDDLTNAQLVEYRSNMDALMLPQRLV